jgi:hypothetical protein
VIAEHVVSWAVEPAKHTLDSLQVRKGLLPDRRRVLVLEITELHEEIDLLIVHHFDAFV